MNPNTVVYAKNQLHYYRRLMGPWSCQHRDFDERYAHLSADERIVQLVKEIRLLYKDHQGGIGMPGDEGKALWAAGDEIAAWLREQGVNVDG
ncbi:MAG TPA: hypothetical protein VGG39_26840 [Polyangiaceae bacterium]|jgi:hypothetical protein